MGTSNGLNVLRTKCEESVGQAVEAVKKARIDTLANKGGDS